MATTTTYQVTATLVLVKSKPTSISSTLTILSKGTKIEVISITNSWAYFKYNNKDAYVPVSSITKVITTGSVTIKYLDIDTQQTVATQAYYQNLQLQSYTYTALTVSGYNVSSNSSINVTLTQSNPNQTITFYYKKILGSITIRYINTDTKEDLVVSKTDSNLALGSYTYSAINIAKYKLVNNSSQTVTLTYASPNATITFEYKKILGSITIKYIDHNTQAEIATPVVYSNLDLISYTYNATAISGYSIYGDTSKTIVLTESLYDVTIAFEYTKILGQVTVQYIHIATRKEIATADLFANLDLGSYSYSAKVIDRYTLVGDSSKSISLTDTSPVQTVVFEYKITETLDPSKQNEVPYISTYYIKPIVAPGEEVIINYYITDYYHKEYVSEDYSDTFTVTVRIDGQPDNIIPNLKAGDQSVSLGSFTKLGEQKFSILCTDQYGRNSHELFNFFLVRGSVSINEYVMTTSDLAAYGISNTNDTAMISSTRTGLQKLLDDKQALGFNKLTLLPGTYRIDHIAPIYIPTQFTLDMNGATLKLNGFTGDKALMVELNNTFDSHVINGVIEGDFYDHDYTNSPNNSEWVHGISIGGESKYSSYENLTIKDITGYGTINGIKASRDGKLGYTYAVTSKGAIGNTFKLGDIDRNTGLDIASTNRTTSDFRDITGYSDIGYLSVSVYLGYQGNPCGTWNIVCHFYDTNKTFIESTDAYQYRRVAVPYNAKYMRVTILNEAYPTNLSIQLFRLPTHCTFKNLLLQNCRAVGMAPQGMNNLLFDSCEFTKCGSAVTKCALDAEDGWDMMSDTTFRNLNFYDNFYNEFLTCAGHNFTLEGSTCGIYIWGRTRNIVIRNSTIKGARIHNDGIVKTGVPRFINNTVASELTFANSDNYIGNSLIKNCSLSSTVTNGIVTNCSLELISGYLNNSKYLNCTIKNIGVYINNLVYFDNCIFTNDIGKSSTLKFNMVTGYREFNNCTFKGITSLSGNYFGKGLFNTCIFENVSINANTQNTIGDLVFNYCRLDFTNNSVLSISNSTFLSFNNCFINEIPNGSNKITSLVYLNKEPSSGQTIFNNCTITKANGYILDAYYTPGYVNKNASYEVILNKSPLPISPLSPKLQNATLQLYKVTIIS